MVAPRNTDTRLDGLEKVVGNLEKKTETLATMVNELKIQCLKMGEGVSALGSQLEKFREEMRAALFYGNPNSTTHLFPKDSSNGHGSNMEIPGGTPPITIPTFDGSEALTWLAQANQYFLINKTPLDRRVDEAINAISGPAMPWLKLLLMRCSLLSWDKFTQELLRRFGDAADRVAKIQPKITPTSNDSTATILPSLPTVTTPLMSSSSCPPTTTLQELPGINTSTNHPDLDTTTYNSIPLPLPLLEQHPIPPPVCITLPSHIRLPTPAMVTAPLLSSSPDILQFQPSFLPLLQHFDPAAAADHAKLMVSSGPPTKTMVSTPRLSSSHDIQIQPPFLSLRGLVFAAVHQSMQSMVSFPDPPYAAVGAPFSYLVMLLFLHIVGHLLWFNALATTQKYEFEPPPGEVLGFNLDLSLEGKAVLRVRQLIRIV